MQTWVRTPHAGIGADETLACWPYEFEGAALVEGVEPLVSAELWGHRACGVSAGGSLACWDWDTEGRASPPEGRFVDISVSRNRSCGVRESGEIECWGAGGASTEDQVLEGRFVKVSLARHHTCGVRVDASLACWESWDEGHLPGESRSHDVPQGRFVDVFAPGPCAVRESGELVCWRDDGFGNITVSNRTRIPSERQHRERYVEATGTHFTGPYCGLRGDGRVDCWYQHGEYMAALPAGVEPLSSLAVRDLAQACGVRLDGSLVCWSPQTGAIWNLRSEVLNGSLGGEYVFVRSGILSDFCAVTVEGMLQCWSLDSWPDLKRPVRTVLGGHFVDVAVGADHGCAIRLDGTVACWGNNENR
ncbi:RCC1 domain-containing protein [Candidatus Poriferisodalis sp.]|uniref:RCC1 domain-containing protein n=1 Tax=Candidatus Poriferisodalis sp. TaxID=3101277 RepID=UPI003B02793E